MTLESRRDAQVDIEHIYYEDSGLADAHARKAVNFHAKVLAGLAPAAIQHQRLLSKVDHPEQTDVELGMPPGHALSDYASTQKEPNLIAMAILNQVQFANPGDAPVLQHCMGIEVAPVDVPSDDAAAGVRITLHFSANEFFSNSSISRTFGLAATASDDFNFVSADEGTRIRWALGKDVTHRTAKRKSAQDDGKVPVLSIFRLFATDGLTPFDPSLRQDLLNAAKPLIQLSAFAVHAACGTRRNSPGAAENEFE
jgi:hypothetical protein